MDDVADRAQIFAEDAASFGGVGGARRGRGGRGRGSGGGGPG